MGTQCLERCAVERAKVGIQRTRDVDSRLRREAVGFVKISLRSLLPGKRFWLALDGRRLPRSSVTGKAIAAERGGLAALMSKRASTPPYPH